MSIYLIFCSLAISKKGKYINHHPKNVQRSHGNCERSGADFSYRTGKDAEIGTEAMSSEAIAYNRIASAVPKPESEHRWGGGRKARGQQQQK